MDDIFPFRELIEFRSKHSIHTDVATHEKYCDYCEWNWPCPDFRILSELISAREILGFIENKTKPGSISMDGTHTFPNLSYASTSSIYNKIREHYGEEPLRVAQHG